MTTEGTEGSPGQPPPGDPLADRVDRLTERVAALEAAIWPAAGPPATASSGPPAGAGSTPPGPGPSEGTAPLSEEILLVLSAAIAAYLGQRAHVRQVRLLGPSGWAREGRVDIQSSHRPSMSARRGAAS